MLSQVCASESQNWDGPGRCQLFAIFGHMGTSAMCTHHVIKKEGRWVIYSNQNVCAFKKLPKDLGYIYCCQRVVS